MALVQPGPATADRWAPAEHEGHLTLFLAPIELEEDVETAHGKANAAAPRLIVCVTCDESWRDCLVFQKVLVRQLTTGPDGDVVGRIGVGEAKGGRSAPWLLEDATAEDVAAAERWLSSLRA